MSRGSLSIFQTRRWPEASEAALDGLGAVVRQGGDRALSQAELRAGLAACDVFCPTVSDRIDGELLGGLDLSGKLIANYGAGTSHIDVIAAKAAGALVSNTPDVLTDCTADIAMLLMLAALRRAGEGARMLRAGQWTGWRPVDLLGSAVTGKTIGLIGFGRIAQAMAARAHFGFGMKVLAWNRSPVAGEVLARFGARQVKSVDELLALSDVVSLHIPGGADTHHFIDALRLAQMRQTAVLINTARGPVVDEVALAAALRDGVIAGAGLDVFENEPAFATELLACESAVLLPHMGSATLETRTSMGLRVVENVRAWLAGETLPDLVE